MTLPQGLSKPKGEGFYKIDPLSEATVDLQEVSAQEICNLSLYLSYRSDRLIVVENHDILSY